MSKKLSLSNLQPAQPRKKRKRVGRGMGSGTGRYAGRGIKGQKSRSGSHKLRAGLEGGQVGIQGRTQKLRGTSLESMPIGPFRTKTVPVNVRDLEQRFEAGDVVTPETLVQKRLIKNTKTDVKILASGELSKSLVVRVHGISETARTKVEAAGGRVELLRSPKVRKTRRRRRSITATDASESVQE